MRVLLQDRILTLLRHRRRARRQGTPDAIHDVRVATRRLQEALEVFAPAFPARERERLRRRARRIRKNLAEVRDADVLLDHVRRLRRESRHSPGGRATPELATLEKRLQANATRLRRGLGRAGSIPGVPGPGIRIRGIRKRGHALLQSEAAPDNGRIGATAVRVARDRSRAVTAALAPARTGRAAALHRLRIAVKRYRYCLETLEASGMPALAVGIAQARDLQERLGAIHDLDVLIRVVGGRAASIRRELREERRRLAVAARPAIAGFRPLPMPRAVRN